MTKKKIEDLKPKPILPANQPATWTPADARAIQALHAGEATPEQQKRALMWILVKGCGQGSNPFRLGGVDGQRETDFASGRLFVSDQIIGLIKINLAAILYTEDERKKDDKK